jgi:serine/threonine protein phosphatase PrpC
MEYCMRYLSKEVQQALFETGNPENALPLAFERVDGGLLKRQAGNVGTTATVCLVSTQGVIYTANVGDSDAYLLSSTEIITLTETHRCDNISERERLL